MPHYSANPGDTKHLQKERVDDNSSKRSRVLGLTHKKKISRAHAKRRRLTNLFLLFVLSTAKFRNIFRINSKR